MNSASRMNKATTDWFFDVQWIDPEFSGPRTTYPPTDFLVAILSAQSESIYILGRFVTEPLDGL